MKKTICLLLSILLCCSFVACSEPDSTDSGSNDKDSVENNHSEDEYQPSGDAEANKDYFEWSTSDETKIVGYTEKGLKQKELIIPEACTQVQGLDENETVKYIAFENPDTKIASNALRNCTNLEAIDLPENLASIENMTFYECEKLKSIKIPDTVTEIGSNAFERCTSLESVTFGKNLTDIGRSAFATCSSLKSIEIPDSVTNIDKSAFEGCNALAEVKFGSGLQTVGKNAFRDCKSLKVIRLPEGLTSIDEYAFAYCDALEEIYLPASLESMEITSLNQVHNFKIYVIEGSYAEQRLPDIQGDEFYEIAYQ